MGPAGRFLWGGGIHWVQAWVDPTTTFLLLTTPSLPSSPSSSSNTSTSSISSPYPVSHSFEIYLYNILKIWNSPIRHSKTKFLYPTIICWAIIRSKRLIGLSKLSTRLVVLEFVTLFQKRDAAVSIRTNHQSEAWYEFRLSQDHTVDKSEALQLMTIMDRARLSKKPT